MALPSGGLQNASLVQRIASKKFQPGDLVEQGSETHAESLRRIPTVPASGIQRGLNRLALGHVGRVAQFRRAGARPTAWLPLSATAERGTGGEVDRKSTRLNSSHMSISYAVFCLKKKK